MMNRMMMNRMMMNRKIFLAAVLALLGIAAMAKTPKLTETPASDSRITYTGRYLISPRGVSFDWSGVSARIRFEGNYLAMKVSDTKKNYFNLFIDGECLPENETVFATQGADTLIVLYDRPAAKGKKPEVHELTIQKRTEGEQGKVTIHSFLSNGELLQAEPLKERMIEFIGDSYTCGYGTESLTASEPFSPETENVNRAYGPIVSRYFDADCTIISHSGYGIARNYNDNVRDYYMGMKYLQAFDTDKETAWHAQDSPFRPAVTVILLGTNDFSRSRQPSQKAFTANYIALLDEIKANWGDDHPILCCAAKGDDNLFEYVRDAALRSGLGNVWYMGYGQAVFGNDEIGSNHPNYEAHKKIAHSIIPYISTITGWPMKDDIR